MPYHPIILSGSSRVRTADVEQVPTVWVQWRKDNDRTAKQSAKK